MEFNPDNIRITLLLNSVGDEELKTYNAFHFKTTENQITVEEIL